MNAGLNIVLILLALLITYWWANQGFFSALLHLLCVIVAGAIALSIWEPLVTGLLLRHTLFDSYAWGSCLLVSFALLVFILRMIVDRLAPASVRLPHGANLLFGTIPGAGAAVLTVGILVIGCSFLQVGAKFMGFQDYGRAAQTGQVGPLSNRLWLPFHSWTAEFYSHLSVTSLSTSRPMAHYTPNLDQWASLVRDSAERGRGAVSLPPDGAEIAGMYYSQRLRRTALDIRLSNSARDHGEVFTLTSSQIRLIGVPPDSKSKAPTIHPDAWWQQSGYHKFDADTNYVSGRSAQQETRAIIEFPTPDDFEPRFVQIRGTRYDLVPLQDPRTRRGYEANFSALRRGETPSGRGTVTTRAMDFSAARAISSSDIVLDNTIRPLTISTNQMPGTLEEIDRYLSSGKGELRRGGMRPSRTLSILGIYEPQGARCVQVNVTRGSTADLYRFTNDVESGATIALVDGDDNDYLPIGYIHKKGEGHIIHLDSGNYVSSIADGALPMLPEASDQQLKLLFYVTEGTTVVGLRFGEMAVGRCNLNITPADEE